MTSLALTPHQLPGAPYLHYQGAELMLEDVHLSRLAEQYGTPLFAYSAAAMREAVAAYQRGFAGRKALICYAMKANSNLAILQSFARMGCGFDIVSGGELARALAAGADPNKIIFSGVGKTRAEMRQALLAGIACFNVESEAELDVLNEVVLGMRHESPKHLSLQAAISLRVNPDVDAKTHPYISTGLKGNKFGIAHERALAVYQHAAGLPGLRVRGIDCHIGSQITDTTPYLDAMDRVLDLVLAIEAAGIAIEHLDFGGGLGINYQGDQPPAADALWQQLFTKLDARGFGDRQIVIEPGRSLVGNAGVCLTEVLYLKPGETKNFCIVDAAMNDLPRPAMYEAFHQIVPLQARQTQALNSAIANTPSVEEAIYDVVGPICESGDWLGRDRQLNVQAGDHLAVLSAGAYCMAMASQYNSRGRSAEVLIDGAQTQVIREREVVTSLWAGERLLP
jgi:diaminopimelate decarboxylase